MNILKNLISNKRLAFVGLLVLMLFNPFSNAIAQDKPILEMVSYSSKLLKPDLTPNVRIYANGVIEIYRAPYLKDPGLFTGQLSDEQLNAVYLIMNSLEEFDVMKAEENYFKASQERKRISGQLYYSSETVITQFKINKIVGSLAEETLILAESAKEKSSRFSELSDWKTFADAEKLMMNFSKNLRVTRKQDSQ